MLTAFARRLSAVSVLVATTAVGLGAQSERRQAADVPVGPPPNFLRRPAAVQPTAQADPVGNGILIGALVGSGVALGALGIMYARCDAGCEAPEPAPLIGVSILYGAGGGALVGWLIDRARTSPRPAPAVGRHLDLIPIVTGRTKGLHVRVTF